MTLYLDNVANSLLGCLIQDPSLCLNDKYPLDKEEFLVQFHRVIYVTINELANMGNQTINLMDLNEFLKPYESQYNIYLDNNGDSYIDTITSITDVENYESYYNQFRKMSCLREYKESGFDIKEIYDVDKNENEQLQKLNEWSIEDIVDYFEKKQIDIKRKYVHMVKEEYKAGTDFMKTKEEFKKEPLVGNSFQSPMINDVFRGAFGFIIRVAKSGGGKTILSVGDLCKMTVTKYWDFKTESFIINKSREGNGLFINTEMDLRKELDPIIISWISGVNRTHIINGKYEKNEESRVDYANEILQESGLYIVDDPEFTSKSIELTIKEYCIKYKIKSVCFDYIAETPSLDNEIAKETKVGQRGDQILLTFTEKLKQIQRSCGISFITSVQSNGTEDTIEYPTEAVLAGGKALARKTDGTMAMFPPREKELKLTSGLITEWNKKHNKIAFGNEIVPNNVVHILKGRSSQYPKYIKIFQYADLSTGRTIDMYATNKSNIPIDIKGIEIEYNEDNKREVK